MTYIDINENDYNDILRILFGINNKQKIIFKDGNKYNLTKLNISVID